MTTLTWSKCGISLVCVWNSTLFNIVYVLGSAITSIKMFSMENNHIHFFLNLQLISEQIQQKHTKDFQLNPT